MDFSPGLHYLSALSHVTRPVAVLAGADDEQFYADRHAALLRLVKPDIAIEIVPGVGHIGAISAPVMLDAVCRALATMEAGSSCLRASVPGP